MPDFEEIVLGRRERGKKSALFVALIVFSCYMVLYEGPAEGYWDTYVAVPAVLIAGEPVDFRSASGTPAYDYQLSRKLPGDLVAPGTFGIATKDQRIGAAVLSAPFFKLFRVFGFRLLYALIPALTALIFFSLVHRITGKRWTAFVTSLVLVLNPFVWSFQNMNANFGALLFVVAIFMAIETDPLRPFVAGLLFGAMGGLRNMAVIFAPLLALWLYSRRKDTVEGGRLARRMAGFNAVLMFGLGAFVAILPFMYWKQFAFGSPFAHPSQYPHFQGFRPTFAHAFMGLEFQFNGLLNFPFHDQWIRTPHFPFPVFLMIPLLFFSCFGLIPMGLSLLGLSSALKENRRLALTMVGWFFTATIFWVFQENWEELKMSFIFLALPPVMVFLAYGLEQMTRVVLLKRHLIVLGTIIALVIVALKFSFFLEFPQDQRWYQRFPKAGRNESALNGLPAERRLAPEFFLTRETEEERLEEKRRLTSICFFYCRYLPVDYEVSGIGSRIREELETNTLTVRPVWDQIYAQQEPRSAP